MNRKNYLMEAVKKRPLCVLCLALVLLILAAKPAGIPIFGEPPDDPTLAACAEKEQSVQVIGTVKTRTEKARSVQYVLTNSYLRSENRLIPLSTISLTSTEEAVYTAGSVLLVSGILARPEKASNPGQFDLRSYYEAQGIYYSLYAESVRVLEEGKGLGEILLRARVRLSGCLDTVADTETAEVIRAMLLGDRTGLTAEMKRNYQVGGILHILAISGMHISLLGQGLLKLLQKAGLPLALAAGISMALMTLYCLMTGAAPSAVRAVCMFAVFLGSKLLLRTYDSLCALALAGILMLLENPGVLFTGGFQLSFCAVLASSLVWPAAEWLLPKRIKKPAGLLGRRGGDPSEGRERLRKKLAEWAKYFWRLFLRYGFFWLVITAAMLPLTAWYYFEIPIWGMLPNLLLVPAAPILLICGIAGITAGFFSARTGHLLLLPAEGILHSFRLLAREIRGIPSATLVCGQPRLWQLLAALLVMLVLTFWLLKVKASMEMAFTEKVSRRERKKKRSVCRKTAAAGLFLILLLLLFRGMPLWSLTMLDVGQGDCLVLRDRGSCFLVDGGSSSVKEVGIYRILPYLKSQGISRLDGILVSHPDEDHINGILEVLQSIAENTVTLRAEVLYLPIWMEGTEEEAELRRAAAEAGVEVHYLAKGDRIRTGTIQIEVLYPLYKGGIRSGNSGSMVLSVSCGAFDALLAGDLETDGEQQLLPLNQTYDYLKVGHHGSRGSTSEEFLSQMSPRIAAISAPENSRYGHPHQETMERLEAVGAEIYITRDCGAVVVEGKRKSWKLCGYLQTVNSGAG